MNLAAKPAFDRTHVQPVLEVEVEVEVEVDVDVDANLAWRWRKSSASPTPWSFCRKVERWPAAPLFIALCGPQMYLESVLFPGRVF
jgi:hypothetical protein